jgi:hypothetical protein
MGKFDLKNVYVCECDDENCELIFADTDWEEAYKKCRGTEYYIFHPDCKRLNDFTTVLATIKYVLVDEE